ncbi:MAG: Mur ligase family protein [Patescibacteria group bacterium]|jgi:UDP-N-acetylmuramoyl-tripeptide--D-alanyl-D-alanine ligase
MKAIIQYILKIIARSIYQKYRPEVIGITGSVGKTSAREAVYAVLKEKHDVRQSIKNYNNEIGLPLTIIGEEARGKNLFGWMQTFIKGLGLVFKHDPNYPKILILEMGADKPGDIGYLLKIVQCKIGIITRVGEAHLAAFKTVEKIKKEKALLVKELKKSGWAVLNYDDERIRDIAKDLKINYISYSLGHDGQKADLEASEAGIIKMDSGWGVSFKMRYKGAVVPVTLPGVVSLSSVYASLAGAAVGIIYGMNLIEISGALKNFKNPKGRLNLIPGVKGTLIIDDSYNASPQACLNALDVLKNLEAAGGGKWAVFGEMLELGSYTSAGHREVGARAAELDIDHLVTVGERAREIARGAKEAGLDEDRIYNFDENSAAGKFIEDRIKKGDIILIKGSQGARMEKIVKEIMADPLRAEELLVRQGGEWD